jgi:hypothetical protein
VELDQEIDRLYGLPLDEFVRARDELAKRLRKQGDGAAAATVKALRKPTAGAWALNQAVRRRREETAALLAAGERLRAAHEALLAGGGAGSLREAMQEERSVAAVLADCAEAIASETGKSGPALKERVRSTLHAAAVDDEAREELATGRFVREREAVGLGPLAGAAPPIARPRRSERPAPAPKTAARDREGSAAATAAEQRERAAQEKHAQALAATELAFGEAREASAGAAAEHRDALDAVDAAREALAEAEQRERAARKAAREADRELQKRERELERLRAKGS